MRGLILQALCGLILILTLVTGCDDDNICNPIVPAGRIEGQVSTGGLPVAGTIAAQAVDLPPGREATFRADLRADGSYGIDVPAGRYIVKAELSSPNANYDYTAAGPGYGRIPPDTLVVNGQRSWTHIDFPLASLTVRVTLPDAGLDGRTCSVFLHRDGDEDTDTNTRYLWLGRAQFDSTSSTVEMPGVLPGRYRIELDLGSRMCDCIRYCDGEHIWLPGVPGPDQADWYDVPTGETMSLEYGNTTVPGRLTGRIGGAWMELGLSRPPELSLISTDSATVRGRQAVGDDGTFTADLYQPVPVKLLITQQGLARYAGGPDFASATVYDLAPGRTISDIEITTCAITMETSISLTGCCGSPIFEIYDPDDLTLLGSIEDHFFFKSSYTLPNLWPGNFLLKIVPESFDIGSLPWIPQWYEEATEPSGAQLITIAAEGDILSLSMNVLTGGTISGRILDVPDPAAFRKIIATPADSLMIWGSNYTSRPEQDYELLGLPDGDYKIGTLLVFTESDPIWYPGTTDWDSATVITLENGGSVEGIDIPLE